MDVESFVDGIQAVWANFEFGGFLAGKARILQSLVAVAAILGRAIFIDVNDASVSLQSFFETLTRSGRVSETRSRLIVTKGDHRAVFVWGTMPHNLLTAAIESSVFSLVCL
jgi:hypothetical protein